MDRRGHEHEVKQPHPGFELWMLSSFPTMITITPSVLTYSLTHRHIHTYIHIYIAAENLTACEGYEPTRHAGANNVILLQENVNRMMGL